MSDYETRLQAFTAKRNNVRRVEVEAERRVRDAKTNIKELAEQVVDAFIEKAKQLIPGFEGIELSERGDDDGSGFHNFLEIVGAKCEYGELSGLTEFPEGSSESPFDNDELATVHEAAELLSELTEDYSW